MQVDNRLLDKLFDQWMLTGEGKKLHSPRAWSDLGMMALVLLLGVILVCTIYYAISGLNCILGVCAVSLGLGCLRKRRGRS